MHTQLLSLYTLFKFYYVLSKPDAYLTSFVTREVNLRFHLNSRVFYSEILNPCCIQLFFITF